MHSNAVQTNSIEITPKKTEVPEAKPKVLPVSAKAAAGAGLTTLAYAVTTGSGGTHVNTFTTDLDVVGAGAGMPSAAPVPTPFPHYGQSANQTPMSLDFASSSRYLGNPSAGQAPAATVPAQFPGLPASQPLGMTAPQNTAPLQAPRPAQAPAVPQDMTRQFPSINIKPGPKMPQSAEEAKLARINANYEMDKRNIGDMPSPRKQPTLAKAEGQEGGGSGAENGNKSNDQGENYIDQVVDELVDEVIKKAKDEAF